MLSLTKWQYIIKNLLKSKLTKNEIRSAILEKCLYSPHKFNGAYQVDEQKVFDLIICKDAECLVRMDELHIKDVFGVISYFEEIEYKNMRATYPSKRRRRL